jgi:hypothetical protein
MDMHVSSTYATTRHIANNHPRHRPTGNFLSNYVNSDYNGHFLGHHDNRGNNTNFEGNNGYLDGIAEQQHPNRSPYMLERPYNNRGCGTWYPNNSTVPSNHSPKHTPPVRERKIMQLRDPSQFQEKCNELTSFSQQPIHEKEVGEIIAQLCEDIFVDAYRIGRRAEKKARGQTRSSQQQASKQGSPQYLADAITAQGFGPTHLSRGAQEATTQAADDSKGGGQKGICPVDDRRLTTRQKKEDWPVEDDNKRESTSAVCLTEAHDSTMLTTPRDPPFRFSFRKTTSSRQSWHRWRLQKKILHEWCP